MRSDSIKKHQQIRHQGRLKCIYSEGMELPLVEYWWRPNAMLWVVDPSLSKRVKVNGKLMKATNPLYPSHPSLFTTQSGAEAGKKLRTKKSKNKKKYKDSTD